MIMYKALLLSLWAYAGLLVMVYTFLMNIPMMLSNALYMILWSMILQKMYGRKEQTR